MRLPFHSSYPATTSLSSLSSKHSASRPHPHPRPHTFLTLPMILTITFTLLISGLITGTNGAALHNARSNKALWKTLPEVGRMPGEGSTPVLVRRESEDDGTGTTTIMDALEKDGEESTLWFESGNVNSMESGNDELYPAHETQTEHKSITQILKQAWNMAFTFSLRFSNSFSAFSSESASRVEKQVEAAREGSGVRGGRTIPTMTTKGRHTYMRRGRSHP